MLPFLYSAPRFTIHQPALLLPIRSSIGRVSKLDFEVSFYRFPQITNNTLADISMPKWKSMCQSIASMPTLTDLSVLIRQTYFFVEIKGTARIAELVVGVLQPLKKIEVRGGQERYLVKIGWRLTEEERTALGNCPFRIEEFGERAFAGIKWQGRPQD